MLMRAKGLSRLSHHRHAFRRASAARTCSSSSAGVADEAVDWPILAGGALAVGLLLSGVALRRKALLRRLQSGVDIVPAGGLIADVSVRQLVGLTMAFALTQLPVEDTKLKLLHAGGLQGWGALLGCFELDQQQIALGALTALLDGEGPLRAFHEQTQWYMQLTETLPPLLHASSASLSDPEILLDTMWLGTALVTHPAYVHTPDDAWLWARLLEQGAEGLEVEPLAALSWSCVAAAAELASKCRRPCLTTPRRLPRLVPPWAQAAAPDPRAQPQHHGSLPWPQQPAAGRPKVEGCPLALTRRRPRSARWRRRCSRARR